MTGLITLTTAGIMTGPFNIYSNVDGYLSAFATNISRDQLLAGYPASNIPDGTTTIRIASSGACYNYIELTIPPATTTTSTSSTSTTTTTSSSSTTTTTTTEAPSFRAWHFSSPGRTSGSLACSATTYPSTYYTSYQGGVIPAMGSIMYLDASLTSPVSGGDEWFKSMESEIEGPVTSYQISSAGELINFENC